MKFKTTSGRWALILVSVWLFALNSFSAVQTSENFDTNWLGAPWVANKYSNVVNSVSGWSISSNSIATANGYFTTPSNACYFAKGGLAALTTPFLSNGIGSVIFDARNSSTTIDAILALESSYDGSSWFTNSIITNRTPTSVMTNYTYAINSFSNQFFRIRRIDNNTPTFAIDTVLITTPTPLVTISNLTNSPARPTDQDPVTISANVGILSIADTFSMTNYWREWPSTSWTNMIAMISNTPSLYIAASTIPGKSIGALIEYHARATYTADGATYTTNSSTNAYVVVPKSSYTNLAVTGQVSASLRNGANYQWQGVIQVTNFNPTFRFQGTSNAISTTWGEVNQSVTNIPLYGQAEVTSSNITLYTTNTDYYLFAFDETNLTENYSVRSCTYENFNTWTNIDASTPPHTNSTGWVLVSGNTSNDASRVFSSTGRSAIVETNGWVQSPYLTNGVGQISLWHRNWQTTGAPTGMFQVQISSNGANWTIPANGSISNIISPNYLFFSVAANDPNSKYVRILNTNTASRLCLDEIAITPPGAGVSAANLGTTPASPTILDPISILLALTPYNGASISSVTAWYRVGTNGQWVTGAMTATDGVHYVLSTPITGAPTGTLQYAVQYFFSGFQASSPAFFPAGGTNNPTSVSVDMPVDNRQENFDTNWPGAPWTANKYSNVVNSVSGWSISSNSIAKTAGYFTTPSNACYFAKDGLSALTTPFLSNGIGSVIFDARNSSTALDVILALESSYNGSTWFTNSITTNRTPTSIMTSYTNTINSLSNQYFRIRRIDVNTPTFAIDTVRITYPPANVAITNIYINPGYPSAGQAFTASCDVITLNPYFPAYNIVPRFTYGTNAVAMIRSWVSGTTNHYTLTVTLGSVSRDTPFDYYVRANFDGYSGSAAENQSPKTSITNSFTVRAFASPYQTVGVTVNGSLTTGRLLTNSIWQAVFTTTSTNTLTFSFSGNGYSAGNGYATNTTQWGNSNNWQQSSPPFSDIAGTNQSIIAASNATPYNGQYVMRFNEQTGQYFLQKCLFQDFDSSGYDSADKYVLKGLSTLSSGSGIKNFNAWSTNVSRSRVEDFSGGIWWTATDAPQAFGGGSYSYLSWFNTYTSGVMRTPDVVSVPTTSYFVQPTHWEPQPILDGIGQVVCTFRPASTNPARMSLYCVPTNNMDQSTDFGNSSTWNLLATTNNITNFPQTCVWANQINTNLTVDIIFAPTSKMSIVKLEVSDWYSSESTINGWTAHQSWMEVDTADSSRTRCRFETSRAKPGMVQGLESPAITGGVSIISFDYSALTTNPISFILQSCYTNPVNWNFATNLATLSNVVFAAPGTTYSNFSFGMMSSKSPIYLRLLNTTPTPGALLLRSFNADGYATTNDWYINNCNVDYMSPAPPLASRQFYIGACYMNSNYVADISTGATNRPDSNIVTCIKSPSLSGGIGEISFWYRNWATTPNVPAPASLKIQKSATGGNGDGEWTTIDTIPNITNTGDYAYYRTDLYDSSSYYVRIFNDFTYSSTVGRVCLDDVLILAPWASRIALSNLVINPTIPLSTEPVNVAVDVYNLFYAPSNITLTAYYSTASNYASLASASLTARSMTCISNNSSTPGQWFRYQTSQPIPTNTSDTFVRYYVSASYSGYHTEATSPQTNKDFTIYPSWLYPLNSINGTSSAYYVVFSCPTGSVWINEFNIADFTYAADYQFIELCGKSGADTRNWPLQILDSLAQTQAVYAITNATFSNMTNNYGFWVIGKASVPGKQQTLTNDLPTSGGFRLSRPSGILVDTLCYTINSTPSNDVSYLINQGFKFVGLEDDWWDTSVILTGSSTNGFLWALGQDTFFSPGSINDGQILAGIASTTILTNVIIYSVRLNTNIWIECTGTNNWAPAPWYSTNLINTNGWAYVTPFGSTYPTLSPSNTYTINFSRTPFTNSPVYFFKVITTNAP